MKVGDIVFSDKVRPYEHALITKIDIKQRLNTKLNKCETRTTYVAEFEDGTEMTFYGFNVNKSVFKYVEDRQITIFDYIEMDE